MKHDIAGVGDAAYDNLCIVENYPEEDGSTHILAIENQGGGCVGTALVAAARLGFSAAYIGNTGDDYAGEHIRSEFMKEGISTEGIDIIKGKRSSIGYVMIDPVRSTRTKFPYKNNLPDIEWTEEKKDIIRNARILHIDGTNYNNCLTAARIARESGVTVSLDGCSRKKDPAMNLKLANMADILIMNEGFPYYATGKKTLEEALRSFSGPSIIISTLGARGCAALINNEVRYFPACEVKAVDTTGAGDAFHGGFLAAYLRGYELEKAIRYASAVAACKCLKTGGRAGLPTHEEVIQFLKENAE